MPGLCALSLLALARVQDAAKVDLVESAPTGKFRVVPLKPFVTPTRAVYEWRVVCDRFYGAFSNNGSTLKVSSVKGSASHSDTPATIFTFYIEVDTKPYGDGSMKLQIYQGHWSGASDPLFPPSGELPANRGSYSSWGADGYPIKAAGSIGHRIVRSRSELPIDISVDLAQVKLPLQKFGYVVARQGENEVYRKAVPVKNDRFPDGFMANPALDALRQQGYTVSGEYSHSGKRDEIHRLLITSIPTERFRFPSSNTPVQRR